MSNWYGPADPVAELTHSEKYRAKNESFYDMVCRIIGPLSDSEEHRRDIKMTLLDQAFLPAGRIQRAIGSAHEVTAYNCFVSETIEDSTDGIFGALTNAFKTMRMGGGIGYDFSTLRYNGALIKSQGQPASGAVSFMSPFDAACKTVASAGNRRGAMMGVIRVDHPDIEEFIDAKKPTEKTRVVWDFIAKMDDGPEKSAMWAAMQSTLPLAGFNLSVGITDKFMTAVREGATFDLIWKGEVIQSVNARNLWDKIMRSTWDYAEPGILFIDRINKANNLWYCEYIAATNPCGEQPLPPYGACLLGSFNVTKYVKQRGSRRFIDLEAFSADIPGIVRMMDNIVDVSKYPLPQQEQEAKSKRRMGLGVTGMANAIEACGFMYGTDEYIKLQDKILAVLRDVAYETSALLAKEKGPFPLYDANKYLEGEFIQTLPGRIKALIFENGIRNSHLLSIAPTGTISISADHISSGIEPVFSYGYDRTIIFPEGPQVFSVVDYGVKNFGVKGVTADKCSATDHVKVLCAAQKFVDSACSKTCNVGDNVTWEEFKNIYMMAWEGGAKGCTTFRASGKRMGIMKAKPEKEEQACEIDPNTGQKTCG
jgi:ribonucleoside-diphosphate reductase alpha chain